MKKLTFTLFLMITLLSCEKDDLECECPEPTSTNQNSECNCGVIYHKYSEITTDTVYYEAVIYNNCSSNDTTVNYWPETNAGVEKEEGDPHCLGVNW